MSSWQRTNTIRFQGDGWYTVTDYDSNGLPLGDRTYWSYLASCPMSGMVNVRWMLKGLVTREGLQLDGTVFTLRWPHVEIFKSAEFAPYYASSIDDDWAPTAVNGEEVA